ncbi:MAG: CobW family GTP-binding protein [Fusicatenibacter sp.]|nr:CobW family GTP-binding protein [Fusicatenibacter sp.]
MSKFYLVTGFLGAGKTTFLKNFIQLFEGQRIHMIVNEYGKEGIDGQLLKELGTMLDEINNGSIFCSCRLDQFEAVLQKALHGNPDVIIVEASGLSNPVNVRKILAQEGKFPGLEYMGSICLVDAKRFHKVYQTAAVVKKQISVSDVILINKTDLATREELEVVRRTILSHRMDLPIFETSFGKIQDEWLVKMKKPVLLAEKPEIQTRDITLRSYILKITDGFTPYELEKFVEMFLEDTYRVKGFVQLEGKNWFLDCVGNLLKLTPYEQEISSVNEIVILAGNGLPAAKSIKEAIKWYPNKVISFEMAK